ncbi:MAG: hypothetical protein HYU58_02490 [Proteobacteria bacterium]|nr:hypothetical protein [Pseudomonadota bacterium]
MATASRAARHCLITLKPLAAGKSKALPSPPPLMSANGGRRPTANLSDRWQGEAPVNARTQALLDDTPHLAMGGFFRGPDGKHRRVTPDQHEAPVVQAIRKRAFHDFAQTGVTWADVAGYPDDQPHPGEDEALALVDGEKAAASEVKPDNGLKPAIHATGNGRIAANENDEVSSAAVFRSGRLAGRSLAHRTGSEMPSPLLSDAAEQQKVQSDITPKPKETKQQKLVDFAKSALGDKSYAESIKKGRFLENSPKRNLWVHDALEAAGIPAPLQPGGSDPLVANSWANRSYKIPGWVIVTDPQPGDVAAMPREGKSGHVGIYVGDDWIAFGVDVVGAGSDEVEYSTTARMGSRGLGFMRGLSGDIVYRRYVGK